MLKSSFQISLNSIRCLRSSFGYHKLARSNSYLSRVKWCLSSTNLKSINLNKIQNYATGNGELRSSPFSIQEQNANTNDATGAASQPSDELKNLYENISNETLESLADKFDLVGEELDDSVAKEYDVSFSNGVLTIKFGAKFGTYVLNKQTPNLQIWLSSPISGPKRYDLIDKNKWIYKRTGESLHDLLSVEISQMLGKRIDFTSCSYGSSNQSKTS